MDAEDIVADMTARIVRRFNPVEVILFGSRARGDNRPDSDVDLIVVLDEIADRRGTYVEVLRELRGSGVPKDVVVATPDEIAQAPALIGSVLKPAVAEGVVLYRRAG